MIYQRMRDDIDDLLEYGEDFTIITYNNTNEDIWGKTDDVGVQSTETLFIVRKYFGDKYNREGVKTVEYVVLIARYNSSLNIGDKVRIDSHNYVVEGIQIPQPEGYTVFKRIRLIREDYE